ncbi:hypothetical protein PG993_008601 [Apiospora rasikravindrae]|uniref:DUF3669 domain-containing protein n=1 Tax=Apiospora rasikravindrae TaxID=990691 RepID=A0ABR1T2L1_9PEZI
MNYRFPYNPQWPERPIPDQNLPTYRRIGQGFCGSVWSCPESPSTSTDPVRAIAIKREDGGPGRSLSNDYSVHWQVLDVIKKCPKELCEFTVPHCHTFVEKLLWGLPDQRLLSRFPEGYTACNALFTERIPPMPEPVRNLLVDKFCPKTPESLPAQIRADEQNHDCLVRPYLGRTKHGRGRSRVSFFSLRNFPLHLDQMAELGLPSDAARDYAAAMAKTLAVLHWKARIDANDIEFVLAPPPLAPLKTDRWSRVDCPGDPAFTFSSPVLGTHCLWILDFDCCRRMDWDEKGVEKAARAFLRNDPFYPRPGRKDADEKELWRHFRATFLWASERIIAYDAENHIGDRGRRGLPLKLMDRIEELVAETNGQDGQDTPAN